MDTDQGFPTSSLSKQGRPFQQSLATDTEELELAARKGLSFRPLLRTVRRKALLIAGITTVVVGVVAYRLATAPLTYSGSFRLLVEPVSSQGRIADPLAVTRSGEGVPSDEIFGLDYPTLLQILQSPGVLSDIVEEVQAKFPQFSYNTLRQGLVVQRIGTGRNDQTKIVEILYQGGDPELVQLVLQETAERYLRYSLEDRKTQFGEGIKFIEAQLPELQQRVESLRDQIQELQQQYELIDPNSQGGQLSENVNQIAGLQIETQRELQEQRTLYSNLQQQLALTPEEAIAASTLSENPRYQSLLEALQEVERQIATESVRFSEESPAMQALRVRQRNMTDLLNREAQQILGDSLPGGASNSQVLAYQNSIRLGLIKQLVDTTNQIRILEARSQEIAQTRGVFDQRLQQFPVVARRYSDLQRQLEIATRTLDQLLNQRETLRIEAAQTEVPWELVSEPLIQRDAAGNPVPLPQSKRTLLLAVAGALLLGAAIAVLLEKYRDVFYTDEDLQDAVQFPLLAVVPFSEIAGHPLSSSPLAYGMTDDDSKFNTSAFLESFTALYARIRSIAAYSPNHSLSLVVCSAAAGDGKSTVALHLAQTAASMGRRVLLVDANLRSPHLHTALDLLNLKGLSDLLTNSIDPGAAIQRSTLSDQLFVLPAGQVTSSSTKLLASSQMQHLMDKFKSMFDLVIYDTPHLFGLTDTNFLADHADGVLMVIGINKTNRSAALQVLNELGASHPASLGIVANNIQGRY
jgi:capsular exopolysaccharide synthesis family protein